MGAGGAGDDVSLKLATRGGTGGHARCSQDPAYVRFFYPFRELRTPSRQAHFYMRSYLPAALIATGLVAGCSFDSRRGRG